MASQKKKQVTPFADIFDEDETEKAFLLSKPTCLIILGKPCQELLYRGQSISEELVTRMILKKIETPEAAHFGYILSGFPSLSEEYMTVLEQIEKIKSLKLKPDFLINIKCPDYDLCQRISGQRQHPDSGEIYERNQWDPDIIEKRKKKKEQRKHEDEEDNEEEEQEDEEEATADAFMLSDILPHLVQRPEDFFENAEERVKLYKDTMLHALEVRAKIYLNVSQPSVLARLQSMGLPNGALITRLQSPEEELPETMENDELFRTLSSYKLIAPQYRWCRSQWGRVCPVALKEGNIEMGLPDLAVSFLGKMYVLSSQEALRAFMLNPRPYLLPPMPLPPCKILVLGPPLSGKTTLCNLIANRYKGQVGIYKYFKLVERLDFKILESIEEACTETSELEVTAAHPEVQVMVQEALNIAVQSPITLPTDVYAAVLQETITEVKIPTNKDRYPGAPEKGGWVVDNYPISSAHWSVLSEKGILPDVVICLKNSENNGICLLHRLYLANKDEINSKIFNRLKEEALKKKQQEDEARKELQQMLKLREEQQAMESVGEKYGGKYNFK
uniref:Uncharacterized protein n=1 Tax=Crocodylus porosus TaxID=8502 RepID=A0A7M4FRL1_CROPO